MDHRPFTFRDALQGVLRRKKLVMSFFAITVVLIGFITLLTPKTYESEARLFIRLGRENSSLDATATMGEQPVVMLPDSREPEINSVVELLHAKQIYQHVVEEIGAERVLKRDWRPPGESDSSGKSFTFFSDAVDTFMGSLVSIGVLNDVPLSEKAVIKLQKKVDIEAAEQSNVVAITFVSYTPELAQLVVNKIVDNYVREHVNLHRPAKAYEFLREQTRRIEQELAESRAALEAYKNETGILASDLQRAVLVERLAKLEDDLLLTEAEEAALDREVNELRKALVNISATEVTATTTGAGNEAADGMRQELYKLEMLREQFAAKYKPGHPMLRELESQVAQAKSILEADESQRTESIQGPNKVHQETSVMLEQKRPQLEALRAKREKLIMQIHDFNSQLDVFTKREREFAKLEREVEVLEANYRKYFVNLEHARIDHQMQAQQVSNIGVAQPATLNYKPYSPNKLINLAAAIFLGAFGGLGLAVFLEYLRPTADSLDDVEASSGAPVIVSIPKLSKEQLVNKPTPQAEIEAADAN